MKKLLIGFIALLLLVSFIGVMAQEDNTSTNAGAGDANLIATNTAAATEAVDNLEGDAGITPDKPLLYGLKLGWEKVSLWATFDAAKKAEKELLQARLRLLEAKKMAIEGKIEAMEKVQAVHNAILERAKVRIQNLQEDSQADKVKDNIKKVVGLQRAIQVHENRIEVLKGIIAEKNLSENAKAKIEAAIDRMENKTETIKDIAEQRKEKIKTRLQAITEKSEDEIDDEVENIENQTGFIAAKKAIAENRIEKAEEAFEKIKEKIAVEKEKGINVTNIEAKIAESEAKIAEAKAEYEKGNYVNVIDILKPIGNYGRNVAVVVKAIAQARQENKQEALKNLIKKAEVEKIKEKVISRLSEIKIKTQKAGIRVQEQGAGTENETGENTITNAEPDENATTATAD